jgi:hypothetical protein
MKKIRYSLVLLFAVVAAVLPGMASADEAMTPSQAVHEWAFSQMTAWSPPGHSFYPDAKESEEDAKTRYRSIVRDAMAVAYDPSEPPLFSNRRFVNGKWEVSDDPIGRAKTLAVLLAVADSESGGYRKDVDQNIGRLARGDGGRSWCVMQIQLSRPNADGKTDQRIALKGDTYEFVRAKDKGYGGEDLIANRRACFRVALHMARESFRACGHLPVEERLSIYAGGDCTVGRAASRVRVGKAIRWLAQKAPPHADADLAGAYPAEQLASAQ